MNFDIIIYTNVQLWPAGGGGENVVNRREWFHLFLAGSHFSQQQQQHCTYIYISYIYICSSHGKPHDSHTVQLRSSINQQQLRLLLHLLFPFLLQPTTATSSLLIHTHTHAQIHTHTQREGEKQRRRTLEHEMYHVSDYLFFFIFFF